MKIGSFLLMSFFILLTPSQTLATEAIRQSVVKVYVTTNGMNNYHPWQSEGSRSSSGTGFIIKDNRILTNAHVVSDATFIQVRKESDPRKFTAHIVATANDCDLAELKVDDPAFFSDTVPLAFGDLPYPQETVMVLGFPTGGDKLSITKGVVSRVGIITYTQSYKQLLAVQIDAAINPGNSGGPVLLDNRVVGVAMQVREQSQNIGYMIPVPIIEHFLADLKDGRYDGFPALGIEYHNTENPALRKYYGIEKINGGVLVSWVQPFASAYGILQEGDVIYEVNGIPVGVDGTFEFRKNERLGLPRLIHSRQVGEKVPLRFIRDKESFSQEVPLKRLKGLVKEPKHFEKPPYYLYGGFVFTVLSHDLLQSWGNEWWQKAPLDFMHYLLSYGRLNKKHKEDIVVLLEIFPDSSNAGYHDYQNEVITHFNGKPVKSFKRFVQRLENHEGEFSIFETAQKLKIILDSRKVPEVTQQIMERNNIPYRFSADVASWVSSPRLLVRDTVEKGFLNPPKQNE